MLPTDAFSADYATARSRFREMAVPRRWSLQALPINVPGFADGELTIDAARIGPADAERLLILSSGLHGPEAIFGSAMQLAWLDRLPTDWQPPAGISVLLLHALNPFGFARLRRVNEDNVDLNRNFLEPAEFARLKELTGREYAPLDPYLNPPRPPGRINLFLLVFLRALVRFGRGMLGRVIPAGQYAFPKGIFFGGEEPAQSTKIIMHEMPSWVGAAKSIIHLDFHTGLGPFATYQLLTADAVGSERVIQAQRIFGKDDVAHEHLVPGGYHNHGDMGEWLSRRFADRDYIYLCAEFGTYGSTRVIGALRRENQAHHWADPASPIWRRTKDEMMEVFSPRSTAWRWTVIHKSLRLVDRALSFWAFQEPN
jgi:hypothetical protein